MIRRGTAPSRCRRIRPIVSGRRLALNSGLLDRIGAILPGNVVLRELGDTGAEPARDAWRRPTHALMWEAA